MIVGRREWRLVVLEPGVFEVSWGEIALIGALVLLLVTTGRVASFVRGVRRGMRDDDPGIRARFIDDDSKRRDARGNDKRS
jgi:Sec-independent protein translocase protein TatA